MVPGCKGASARKRGQSWPVGVAQGAGVPLLYQRHLAWRDVGGGAGPGRLQRGVATAVVAVQVGVEDALQWLRAQQPLHQATVCSLWVQ